MGDRVRTDRHQRIGSKRLELLEGHAELAADRALVDAVARAQARDLARHVVLAWQRAQPVVQLFEGRLLLHRRPGLQARHPAADLGLDVLCIRDRALKRDPPQPSRAGGKIARHVDGVRGVELAKHRQRMVAVVAIAVVQREGRKAAREIPVGKAPIHFVHGDDVDLAGAQMRQHRAQESRLDFEVMVGLEGPRIARADMMQHEDGADARENRPQQMVRAGEIQRFQAGADHGAAELLHQAWLYPVGFEPKLASEG